MGQTSYIHDRRNDDDNATPHDWGETKVQWVVKWLRAPSEPTTEFCSCIFSSLFLFTLLSQSPLQQNCFIFIFFFLFFLSFVLSFPLSTCRSSPFSWGNEICPHWITLWDLFTWTHRSLSLPLSHIYILYIYAG